MQQAIVCATDGSKHSQVAASFAAHLAKSSGGKLTFLAVNAALGGPRGPLTYQWDNAEVKNLLDQAASIAKEVGASDFSPVAVKGRDPARAIVQYAEENGIDHIVVGTGDRSAVSRLMLGSVARDVAARAHCSVTIAR